MKIKLLFIVAFTFFLHGCASHKKINVQYTANKVTQEDLFYKSYTVGLEQEASVGDIIISTEDIVDHDISMLVKVNTYLANANFSLTFPNGKLKFETKTPYYSAYSYGKVNFIQNKVTPKDITKNWVVYLPISVDFKIAWDSLFYSRKFYDSGFFIDTMERLEDHPNFKFDLPVNAPLFNYVGQTVRTVFNTDANIFKTELIYAGKSKNTIKFLYREYYKKMIRDGFTHELSYDLDESNIIRHKKVRIEIKDSTNEAIKYKVISD